MKKVVIISTGGTIAMKRDAALGGLAPAADGAALLSAVPGLRAAAEVETETFSNVPSGHITPGMMLRLARLVDQRAARANVDGVVVTHGTDTMEETAYFLSLACRTEKPVVVTGAMRGADSAGWDGPGNLLAAARTAASPEARGRGALLVMNDEIHAAADAAKCHTVSCGAFASPGWGPLGHVYEDGVVFHRAPARVRKILANAVVEDVALIKTAAGTDDFFFRCAADQPVAGIVVEALGCGNVPPASADGIRYARQKGLPVVLASRVGAGRVAPVYAYPGSAGALLPLGVILAGELSGPKARLALMLALALTRDNDALRAYFSDGPRARFPA